MQDFLNNLNKSWNLDELFNVQNHWQELAGRGIALVVVVVVALILGWIVRAIIGGLIARIASKTQTRWDDYLFDQRFFATLGRFLPATAGYFMFFAIVESGDSGSFGEAFYQLLTKLLLLLVTISGTSFLNALIQNFERGFLEINGDKRIPIRSYVQVVKLLVILVAVILVVSIVLEQNPAGILAGLAGLTAVLLLVFKDALLGLVASLQLNSNNIVQVGDWIEFPNSNIEGEVIDIALSVVKVKGGDNTVYSMPTYNLVSVPFKNWRNVKESGARRLRLAFPVDTLSLAMLTEAQKEALRAEGLWQVPEDQAQVTNLEAYRYWAQSYLDSHVAVHTASARLVKIGDPTGRGIPVEMVFHSKVVASPDWELLRSRLYCHYLAHLSMFGLRVFQEPVGVVEG